MAEETTAAATPANGEAAPSGDRAAVLAEIKALDTAEPTPSNGETEAPAPTEEPETPTEPVVPPPAEAPDEDADDVDDEEGEDGDTEVTPAAPDADLNKRLASIQQREKRAKEGLARERETYLRERAAFEQEWAPRIKEAENFNRLASRVRHDPVGVLTALGLTEDDLDPVARVVYAHSKEARADPKMREAAARTMRERELALQVQQLTQKMEERDQRDQQREQQETTQREVTRFLDGVAKAATDGTPIVRAMLEKNPEKTRLRLSEIAQQLIADTGEVPDHVDVVAELEKLRRAELEELGIEIPMTFKTKKTSPVADEKRPAKTLTNELGKPTAPRSAAVSRKEELADVRRALETGRLE